jgi:hypothetical protein
VKAGWTHTLSYDDVRDMLAQAKPGMAVKVWRERAAESSRFMVASQRTEQLRLAALVLRLKGETITDDQFLADLASADRSRERDLIYARYLTGVPVAVAVARSLFGSLLSSGRPISFERTRIAEALSAALPQASPATKKRSLVSFTTEFVRAGILTRENQRSSRFALIATDLDPIAFYDALRDELVTRGELRDGWIAREATPTLIYALSSQRVGSIIESLVQMGRLRRSYFSGEPRVLVA